ncbi:hypothetical protein Zmor_026081 [Zophobas morio]|uniref:Regulatory protein zeste n=1 Tax=Zophobas morio TaxID=2755281 RepID=A0AA38HTW8_9CUCU|nr:hypothetical protein Zmor_026081 [Zophobas morio]
MRSENKAKTTRGRAPNYTPDEKLLLLNIIKKYSHVVENKKTDSVTWEEKKQAWKAIAAKFNAASGVHRSTDSIKMFFDNHKRMLTKKAANDKFERKKTGGGRYVSTGDPFLDLTLDIVNKKTVYGHNSRFDGDAPVNEEVSIAVLSALKTS